MRIVEIKKDIIKFELYKNNPVCVYEDYFVINETKYLKDINDVISEGNGVLKKYKDKYNLHFYKNGIFEPIKIKYSFPTFFEENVWIEYSYLEDKIVNVRFMEHGKETLFSIKTPNGIHSPRYIKDKSIFLFNDPAQKYLLAYSKTGEFLWQYTEEDASLKINWRCIPVVDDVVVIISEDISAVMKIQGFNIRTGELLWTLEDSDMTAACPDTFFVGDDNMLYGCDGYYGDTAELHLCRLNPITGELDTWVVLSDNDFDVLSWHVAMHGRRLYYTDNRKGKEIGVIDVDRKELVERQPMGIEKNVTLGAPVVTDDKVYVYIRELNELRVYENIDDAYVGRNRVERAEIKESSVSERAEETNHIERQQQDSAMEDNRRCEKEGLKDEKKEYSTQLNADVNWFIINDYYRWDRYCALINGEETKIDVDQRTSFKKVDSFYEYSSVIIIKGEEIDRYDDATYGYIGYHDVYPGYVDISNYENEESVLRQIPQSELKEILIGDGYDGYKTVRLIPKRYIEKMIIRQSFLDWDVFMDTRKICQTGESRVIAELDMQSIDKEMLDVFKRNDLIWTYEDLSVLLDDKYVSSFVSRHHLICHTCRNALLMAYGEMCVFIFYKMKDSEYNTFFCYDRQTDKFIWLSNYRKEEIVYGEDVSVDYPKGQYSYLYRQIALLDKYLGENPDFEMSKFSDCLITNVEMKKMYGL